MQRHTSNRPFIIIGHAAFLAYLLFTILYYKERLLNCDAAYYTFHVINYEDFFIKHQRYISYFTQWAPILLIKLGGSLKTVMMAYSIIFGLWFYGMYLVVTYLWKNPKGGLLLALSLFLAMRYKHYAGHTEITFAIAVATMLVVWITTNKEKLKWFSPWIDYLIKGCFIAWLYIIHPIIIVPLAIVLAADMIYYQRWKIKGHWGFILLLLLSFIFRFVSVAKDSYESGKISILSTGKEVFSNPGDYYVFTMLGKYITNEYIPPLIMFIAVLVWLFNKRKILSGLTLILGFIALSLLIIITYSYLRGDIYIMIDGYLGMLGMVWGFAIYLFLREENFKQWHVVVVGLLIFYCQLRIWEKNYILERRLLNYIEVFDRYPDNPKLFAHLRFHDWDNFWYPYEIPFESLMLTSLEGPEKARTLFIDYDDRGSDGYLEGSDYFLNFYNKTKVNHLNKKFFRLSGEHTYKTVDAVPWK